MTGMFVRQPAALATFSPDRMTKGTLARGEFLFAGLNAFEPGQEHAPHTHEGQDKLYVVLQGAAEVLIGDATELLATGDIALAPSGVLHSIRNPGPGRLVVMAVLGPPPGARG